MSPPSFKTTEPIAGCTVQERIGAGGYGEVWKAEAPGGIEKAIKFVYGYLDDERAARELKALNRIKEVRHPFLLSLDRIEVIDGQLVIVMELAESSLQDRFEEAKKSGQPGIPREEVLVYIRDAADALDYMCEKYSLQHLDIKPENLLIVGGRVKVADFGLVKDVQDTSMSLLGGLTPVYAAPEVFEGRPCLHSDQYSLAIVYQEMVTGALPFPGKTVSQLAAQHLHSPPRLASLSPSDRQTIARALSKDPEQRFPSCRAMVESLTGTGESAGAQRPDSGAAAPEALAGTGSAAPQAADSADQPGSGLPSDEAASGQSRYVTEKVGPGDSRAWLAAAEAASQADSEAEAHAPPQDEEEVPFEPESFPEPQPPAPVRELPPVDIDAGSSGIRPVLVVGIGGTGARTLRRLRRRLQDRFGSLAMIPTFRMLLVDSDAKTIAVATRHDESDALDASEAVAMPLRRPQDYRSRSSKLLEWLSRRWLYNIPRSLRTEGLRPLGRLALIDHAQQLIERLGEALASITARDALSDASTCTGMKVRTEVPRVFVVSSIAGGTGGGMVIDVAYAVRKVLRDMGLSDEDVCGVLTYSTNRNPHESDLAAANAYACLNELQHYGCWSAYPGDPGCGLPAFPRNTAPFGTAYLAHLGTDLTEEQFDEAVDALAEYLYLDTATAGGAFFDTCRRREHEPGDAPPAEIELRTFGIWHVGCSFGDLPAAATELLSERVIERWRGHPDDSGGQKRIEPSIDALAASSDASEGAGETTPAPSVEWLAGELTDKLQLTQDPLTRRAEAALEHKLGSDPDAYFRGALRRFLPEEKQYRRHPTHPTWAAEILAAIDSVLGPRRASRDSRQEMPNELYAHFENALKEQGLDYRELVARWILESVESHEIGAGGAQRAAAWFSDHLRSLDAEFEKGRRRIEKTLADTERKLSSQRSAEEAPSGSRFGLVRRSKRAPSLEDQWLEYCRLRLSRCALLAASRLVRSVDARVSQVADLLSDLQRQLGLLSGAFDASAFQKLRDVAERPPASPVDEVRQFVAHRLGEAMPRLAKELDQEIRAKFFGKQRQLCDVLTKDLDFRESLVSALRHPARRAVTRSLKQIDITRLLLSSDDRQTADQRLGVHLEKATPRLLSCGGSRRLLIVLPDGCSDTQVREAVESYVTENPTLAFDSDFDMVLCWEMGEMPISRVALTLIEYRVDYAQVASRLHTRVDVSWSPLTRCLQPDSQPQ